LKSKDYIALDKEFGPQNYAPLEVVVKEGEGVWVKDVEGKSYLDMLSAYSALNFGHRNQRILDVAIKQLGSLTLTSRAYYNDVLILLARELSQFCDMEMALLMNTGAEAVESAIKVSRRWAYTVKGVEADKAEIICFNNNFHGRTTTIIGFSTSDSAKENFGPFTPGFCAVPFADVEALRSAINKNTAAVLIEPIQGEGGVIIPPAGYLQEVRQMCSENNVLMIADEIQTGLCRTGEIFACDHEKVKPDIYILGKSLGGGLVPISAVVSSKEVLGTLTPGSHGSTFGGNPLACAIAREVLSLIKEEKPEKNSKELGEYFLAELKKIDSKKINSVRGRGLFMAVDIASDAGEAKKFCNLLLNEGVLCKDTRTQTLRFAPPLVIKKSELDWALERIAKVFAD